MAGAGMVALAHAVRYAGDPRISQFLVYDNRKDGYGRFVVARA